MPRCNATKPNGAPCERIVPASKSHCYAHDPAHAQARSRAASKAARSRPNAELAAVKVMLQDVADRTLKGILEPKVAAVVAQVLNVKLRAVEIERKIKE